MLKQKEILWSSPMNGLLSPCICYLVFKSNWFIMGTSWIKVGTTSGKHNGSLRICDWRAAGGIFGLMFFFYFFLIILLLWSVIVLVGYLGIGGASFVALIIVNLYATYCCMRTPDVKKQKKNYQIAFVWLVPMVGAIAVWAFSKPEPLLEAHGGHGSSISGGSVAGTNYYSGSDSGGSGSDC